MKLEADKVEFTILGAGAWGVALGEILIHNGCQVSIWHYRDDYISDIKEERFHKSLNYNISKKINFTSDYNDINPTSCIIICLPSQKIREVLSSFEFQNTYYINASKGIEVETGK